MKLDQRLALMDFVDAMVKATKEGMTIVEKSKATCFQSNGVAEKAIQGTDSMVERVGGQITSTHALTTWMAEHAAEMFHGHYMGTDGHAPHECNKRKAYQREQYV